VRLWSIDGAAGCSTGEPAAKKKKLGHALESPQLLRTLRTKSTPVLRTAFYDAPSGGGFLLAGGGFCAEL
jgi:hypothetical protein